MRSICFAMLVALTIAGCTRVDARQPLYSEGFQVQGVGLVQAKPDIALLGLGIEAQSPVADAARAQASDALAKVLAVLRESGVASEDIQTSQFVLRYGWGRTCDQSSPNPQPSFPGAPAPAPVADPGPIQACVLSSLQARIRDLSRVDRIIDGVISAAAPTVLISGIRFTVEKPEQAVQDARIRALEDARKKAETQAAALGVRLAGVRQVSTFTQIPQFGYEFSGGRAISAPRTGGGPSFQQSPEVVVGLNDIVVTANVIYDLEK